MELYSSVSYKSSAQLTRAYSTSFSLSSLFFPKDMRRHIYAIYGLVRVADEIVDTYKGAEADVLLDKLEQDTYGALKRHYDTNPIVHAFAETASRYGIDETLIAPFFKSMRVDLDPQTYDHALYREYIHGSAEVVGLMCLRVFCGGNNKQYKSLKTGAAALGAAYQKVNFLRDMANDYQHLGRIYFPGVRFESFGEKDKAAIIEDIENDFATAYDSLKRLPKSSRIATMTSYVYYRALLKKLGKTPAAQIVRERVRISDSYKMFLLAKVALNEGWRR